MPISKISKPNRSNDYERVAEAIRFLDAHFKEQPRLKDVASAVGLSEFHFQRLFRRWAGISPKRFLQYLTAEYARSVLLESQDVLAASFDSGLSGPGRLHDLLVNIYAATPAQVSKAGANLVIEYGFASTPFGACLVAQTDRGLCGLSFIDVGDREHTLGELQEQWPNASFVSNDKVAHQFVKRIFSAARRTSEKPITVHLKGTNFQIRVWEAMLRIPPGKLVTYSEVAQSIGEPRAVRAVGSAVGRNPIAYVIPCHRVLLKSGVIGNYRWGSDRKRAILGWEAARFRTAAEVSK